MTLCSTNSLQIFLAPLFFPSDSPSISIIVSMATYGVGFLAQPLGGIFFGHLGDRRGRKTAYLFPFFW